MYVCVCVCVCMYVHVRCVCVCMRRVCLYVYMRCVCVCVYVYSFIYPGGDLNLNRYRLMGTHVMVGT